MTRTWQRSALEKFTTHSRPDFLVTATPGAGKTRFALAAARELLDAGMIDRVVVVCPTTHLRGQWKKSAHDHFRIELDPTFENGKQIVAADYHGPVVTYGAVASEPQLYRKLTSDRRTLVVLDEVHHAGESRSWGAALRTAFEPAVRRLLLSGTPFRSDNNAIPFVTYVPNEDGVMRSHADYSYDYGRALNEGVVRPIQFNALDGYVRWIDASATIQGAIQDEDVDLAKKALRHALNPDGAWIKSVLRQAVTDLDRVRADVPDAGGLVVAPDQDSARAYAKLIEGMTGEPAGVAVSDDPNASTTIDRFTDATSKWLVAVNMVSEGVDIPRLAVGVYASTYMTRLFFRQVVGRFIRTRNDSDELCASLFVPSIKILLAHAAEIEVERDHALSEAIEKAEREQETARDLMLDISVSELLDTTEAVHRSTILAGQTFDDAELARALEYARQAGMSNAVPASQVAHLLRLAGLHRDQVRVEVPAQAVQAAPAVADEKAALRKQLARRVAQAARAFDEPHKHIHGQLNKFCGDTVPTATVAGLRKRIEMVDDWLRGQ